MMTIFLYYASRLALHVEMLGDICTRRGSQVSNSHDLMRLLLADQ